jgi:hypothetical protein
MQLSQPQQMSMAVWVSDYDFRFFTKINQINEWKRERIGIGILSNKKIDWKPLVLFGVHFPELWRAARWNVIPNSKKLHFTFSLDGKLGTAVWATCFTGKCMRTVTGDLDYRRRCQDLKRKGKGASSCRKSK